MNAALTTLSISEITKRCFGTLLPKTLVCRNHSAGFCAHGDGVGGTTFMFFEPLGKMILTSSISASHAFPHQLPLIPARKPVLPPPGSKPLINPLTLVIFLMCQQDYSLLLQCGFQEANWSHRRGCFCRLPAVFFVGEEDFPNSQRWVPEFRFSQKNTTIVSWLPFASMLARPGAWSVRRNGFHLCWLTCSCVKPASSVFLWSEQEQTVSTLCRNKSFRVQGESFSAPSGTVGWRLPSAASCHRTGSGGTVCT